MGLMASCWGFQHVNADSAPSTGFMVSESNFRSAVRNPSFRRWKLKIGHQTTEPEKARVREMHASVFALGFQINPK